MALNPGTKLGSYEIISLVGVGGMGEVYRAKDTRLGREVALKILPAGFARDADRLRRFEQEARAVAALNHPNILAIHDIGQQDDMPFLVSELLEGENLRAILDRGALPQRKAIDYGVQTAQGLAAAHEKGIVHRDLKPENLFITKDGRVKILDFGLAKLAPQKSDAPEAIALTLTHEQTQAGVVMGTAGYMAPEQVRGEAADPRTDIFAFGAVLFEMLSGQRAFRRDTAAETMTAVLKDDPPELAMSEHAVTPALDRIMKRCLEKSPEQRFQSAKDLAFALEALSGSAASTAKQQAIPAARKNKWMPAAAACIAIAAIAAAYLIGSRTTEKPASFTRLTFQRGYIKRARFAPDGQNVIYSATWEGRPFEIFSTKIGDNTSRPLGLTDAMALGVSDSGEIALLMNVRRVRDTAFLYKGTLARAQDSGGTPREILDDVWDADISRDGKQFAVVRAAAGPQQLEYPIGKVLFKTDGYISDPRISPDGKSVAFMEHPLFGDDRGYVSVVDSNGNAKRLTTDASTEQGVVWSRDGKEIWFGASEAGTTSGERAVWAVTPAGKMRKVFQVPEDCTAADIAADGRLLFTNDKVSGAQMVASPASSVERDVSVLGSGYSGSISADGKMIAFTESGSGVGDDYAVFFRRLDGSPAVELGEGDCIGMTPDGKYVVALLPTQPTKLRVLPTGAGEARTFDIAPVSVDVDDVSWMPGAKEFVFLGHEGVGPPHAYRVSIDGGSARPLTNQAGAHFWNRVSLDGKYLIDGPGKGNNWQSKWELVELATGQARPAALLDGDQPASWDQDNKHIFVAHEGDGESTVFRVDAFSGERKVWKQIQPADPSGLNLISFFQVTPSGSAYSYGAGRMISSLYVYSK